MRNTYRLHRRTGRTREKLLKAFAGLVLSQGYPRVSVRDIAASAGVGRSTLYMHFGGLPRLLEASLERPCITLASAVRVASSPGDLVPLLRHFHSQAQGHNAVFFRDPIYSLWARCLARAITASLRKDPQRFRYRPAIPRELLCSVLAELQLAIIRHWLMDASSASAETIAAALIASTQRLLMGRAQTDLA